MIAVETRRQKKKKKKDDPPALWIHGLTEEMLMNILLNIYCAVI